MINESLSYIHTSSKYSYDIVFHLLSDVTYKLIKEEIVVESLLEHQLHSIIYEQLIKSVIK